MKNISKFFDWKITPDGIHLNSDGYVILSNHLKQYLI